MKRLLLLSLIFLVILVAGCTKQDEKPNENTTTNGTEGNATKLSLTINITKNVFTLGEALEGNYIIENEGSSFKAFVVVICGREGYENSCKSRGIDTIENGKTIGGYYFKPCEISEKGAFCNLNNFTIPGTYSYELTLYDCIQIRKMLNLSCDSAPDYPILSLMNYEKIKSNIPPLATTKKTIIVA
jgi:hypothetical protein